MSNKERNKFKDILPTFIAFFEKERGGLRINARTGNLETGDGQELQNTNHIGAILMFEAEINISDKIINRILCYIRKNSPDRHYESRI